MSDSTDEPTAVDIAGDLLDYLAENDGVAARVDVSENRQPHVRYHGDCFEAVEVSEINNLEVTSCTKQSLIGLFAEHSVRIMPESAAKVSIGAGHPVAVWDRVEDGGQEVIYA